MGREIVNALVPDQLRKNSWYPDYLHLMGQLLTWCYLSEHNLLNEEIRFNGDIYHTADHSLIAEILSAGLSGVSAFRSDPVWNLAWSNYQHYLQAIPAPELERLTTSLATARRHGLIRYHELPDMLYGKYLQVRPALPSEVRDLVVNLLPKDPQHPVYLSGDGAFGFMPLLTGKNIQLFSEHPQPETMHSLIALLSSQVVLREGDPVLNPSFFQHGRLSQFAYGVGVLLRDHSYKVNEVRDLFGRFSSGIRHKEILFVTHMLHQCSGSMVLVIPGRFLLKNTAESRHFRKKLIQDGRLSGVIRLPAGLLPGRAQPLFVLIFAGDTSNTIRFVNSDNDYFKSVAVKKRGEAKYRLNNPDVIVEEIRDPRNTRASYQVNCTDLLSAGDTHFPLDPGHYLGANRSVVFRSTGAVSVLDDGFEIIRAQALRGAEYEQDIRVFMEVTVNDINDAGLVEAPKRIVQIGPDRLKRAKGQTLQAGDILLAIKGQAGKLALVPELCGNNWVAGQSFVILRQKPGNGLHSPVVLFRFLKSETGRKLIDSIRTDNNVPFIHSQDLKQLPVPCWSDLEQEQACQAHEEVLKLYARMKFFREKAELIERAILKEA
ncbi:N-6 DNA methylase [Endozoicomonas acroporae]|uniref:restriction endonuclease subunit S n=1 Tax=Endozoicomonas acroporae TaxID=1701104 RepID=UPI003D7AA877